MLVSVSALLASACERRSEPLPFDWPSDSDSRQDWGLMSLAPTTATLTTKLVVESRDGAPQIREDRWSFEVQDARSGRVVHEMVWNSATLPIRREKEEAILEDGRLRTRTLGPDFQSWPDDERWRGLIARPATDWEGLEGRMAGGVEVRTRRRDSTGAVLAAQLTGSGDGWRAELSYQVQGR